MNTAADFFGAKKLTPTLIKSKIKDLKKAEKKTARTTEEMRKNFLALPEEKKERMHHLVKLLAMCSELMTDTLDEIDNYGCFPAYPEIKRAREVYFHINKLFFKFNNGYGEAYELEQQRKQKELEAMMRKIKELSPRNFELLIKYGKHSNKLKTTDVT